MKHPGGEDNPQLVVRITVRHGDGYMGYSRTRNLMRNGLHRVYVVKESYKVLFCRGEAEFGLTILRRNLGAFERVDEIVMFSFYNVPTKGYLIVVEICPASGRCRCGSRC